MLQPFLFAHLFLPFHVTGTVGKVSQVFWCWKFSTFNLDFDTQMFSFAFFWWLNIGCVRMWFQRKLDLGFRALKMCFPTGNSEINSVPFGSLKISVWKKKLYVIGNYDPSHIWGVMYKVLIVKSYWKQYFDFVSLVPSICSRF